MVRILLYAIWSILFVSTFAFGSNVSSAGFICSTNGTFVGKQGGAMGCYTPAGGGDVTGPGSATVGHLASFGDTGGTTLLDNGPAYDNIALLTGNQTIAGIKTLSSNPVLSGLTASKPVCTTAGKALTSTCTGLLVWGDVATGNNYRLIATDGSGVAGEAAAITASRAVVSDANGIPTHATTTATEIGYVNGVTSAIQTQLNAKLTSTGFVEEWILTAAGTALTDTTYDVLPYSALGRKVVSVRIACRTSGTVTVALKIDGVDITDCAAISVTSTPQTVTCDTGSSSTLAANSLLTLVTSSNSSCTNFYANVKTTRQ